VHPIRARSGSAGGRLRIFLALSVRILACSAHDNQTVLPVQVGKVTSVTDTETGFFGLGYIKRKVCSDPGLVVQIGGAAGTVVDVPFVRRTLEA
jgi:hypothetical protein